MDGVTLPHGWSIDIGEGESCVCLVIHGPEMQAAAFVTNNAGVRADVLRALEQDMRTL